MFTRKFDADGPLVRFTFDGQPMTARQGDSVAAALLENGVTVFRESAVSGAKRAPYCLMGVCFECLVVVDGVSNRQACLVSVEDGMAVNTQRGRRQFQLNAVGSLA